MRLNNDLPPRGPAPFRAAVIIGAISAAFALSSCGIKGDLKTPPPVFGSGNAAKPLPPAPIEGDDSANIAAPPQSKAR